MAELVEGAPLLRAYTRKTRIVGSNPTLSANVQTIRGRLAPYLLEQLQMVIRTHDVGSVGFDKIVGNDFEQCHLAALARRAEGRDAQSNPTLSPPDFKGAFSPFFFGKNERYTSF
jgi:hypothetical protein